MSVRPRARFGICSVGTLTISSMAIARPRAARMWRKWVEIEVSARPSRRSFANYFTRLRLPKPAWPGSLVEFRESLKTRGLVSFLDDCAAFRIDLFRHLSQTVIRVLAPGSEVISELAPSQGSAPPDLSEAGRELLLEAVKDRNGRIMFVRYLAGMEISTKGRNFIGDSNPRTVARWEGAIDELESHQLILARSGKREVFSETDKG